MLSIGMDLRIVERKQKEEGGKYRKSQGGEKNTLFTGFLIQGRNMCQTA